MRCVETSPIEANLVPIVLDPAAQGVLRRTLTPLDCILSFSMDDDGMESPRFYLRLPLSFKETIREAMVSSRNDSQGNHYIVSRL